MNDFRKLLDALDSVELDQQVTEKKAKPPSKFKPTHFHKSEIGSGIGKLFGKKGPSGTKLMYHNGEFWHMATDDEGGRKIARWNGDPNNRSKMNPASVDGEIVNGKFKPYPKGVTFKDREQEKTVAGFDAQADADAKEFGKNSTGRQDGPDSSKPNKDWKNPDADKSTKSTASSGSIKDGKITFSDGSTFYRDPSGKGIRLFNKKLMTLIKRMDALVTKMNESVPNSLKAVLSESDKAYLLLEALNDKEAKELIGIIADLELAMQAKDEEGYFIGNVNRDSLQKRISAYRPTVDKAKAQLSSSDTSTDKDGNAEPEPEAKAASDASGDKGAAKDAEKKPTAGSLAKFAKSGKGGLANDPDETAAIDELQTYLNDLGFDTGTPDGKYGPATVKGVKAFQEYFGAKVDGDAGPETIGQIIKLRSIGFKGGKTFVDFRKDMKRMEELLAKSGAKAEGKDMSSMSSILEALRRIDEALDEKEAKELADLVAQYDDVMNDAEFSQAIPKPSYDRYKKIYDAAKKLAPATSDSKGFKDGDEIPAEYLDADGNPDWSKIPPEITMGTIDGVGVERPPADPNDLPPIKDGDEIPDAYLDKDGNPDWSKIPPEVKMGTIDGVGVERPPEDKQPDAQMDVDQPGGDTSSDTTPGADDTDDPDAKRGQSGGLGDAPGMDDPNIDQTQVDRDSMFKTDVPDKEAKGIWRVEKDDKGTYNLVGPDGTVDTSKGMNGRFSQAKVPEMQKIADRLNKEQGLPKKDEPAGMPDESDPTQDAGGNQTQEPIQTGGDAGENSTAADETPLRPDAEARLKSYMSTKIDATDDQNIIDLAKKIVADDEAFAVLQKEDPTTAEALRAMAQ